MSNYMVMKISSCITSGRELFQRIKEQNEIPIAPHSEILFHPSQVGRVIIIKGKTYEDAQRFAVNLVCRERRDIAVHFNPRLDRGYIARNTKLNGTWGVEENSLNGPSPFEANKEFTLQILVAEDEYRFCHNGRHICSYKHRVPIARLHLLEINGDVNLTLVQHEIVEEFPPPVSPVAVSDLALDTRLLSVGHASLLIPTSHNWQADIPKQSFFFLGRFEPHIHVGNEIIIGGNVRLLPRGFFINLQNGLQMWKSPDVHLHINPRFEDHNHVIVNARLKGQWGYEERHTRCRFQPGRPFTLTIRVEDERYRAFVNGYVLASMEHRARPTEINSIYISGDVDVTSIGFKSTLTTLKSPRTTNKNEVTIAEDPDWVDLAQDIEPLLPRASTNTIQSVDSLDAERHGIQDISQVEADVKDGKRNLNSLGELKEKESLVAIFEPSSPSNSLKPKDLKPDSLPSPSEVAGSVSRGSTNENEELAVVLIERDPRESISTVPRTDRAGLQPLTVGGKLQHVLPGISPVAGVTTVSPQIQDLNVERLLETDANIETTSVETVPLAQDRPRGDSIVSDDSIFLSARHTLTESDETDSTIDSKVSIEKDRALSKTGSDDADIASQD